VLHGTVTGADQHTWREVPFEVPPGTTRITVDFDYTTRDQRTAIDLGVLGPDGFKGQDGFRGWSGGNKRHFTLSATDATPSYLPGPIRPGRWSLLLGIPNIRTATQAQYTATIRFDREDTQPPGPVLRATAGWYRGDMHMHTAHSDGSCSSRRGERVPCPLFLTVEAAESRRLDFIAITDHNTVSHAQGIRELQPYFDDLLLIPGREVTTFEGHANLLGPVAPVDFRVGSKEVPDWNTLLARLAQAGGVVSINHPVRPSGEDCMGCGWTPRGDIDYHRVQGIEVVNGLDADTPLSGVPFWERLLNQGYRLTALGSSDSHDALKPAVSAEELPPHQAGALTPDVIAKLQSANGAIATPTTVVYADALSQEAILAGIRRGRVFIDVGGTRDRTLDLTASTGEGTSHMGDTLAVAEGTPVHFSATVAGLPGGVVQVIFDGAPVAWLSDPHMQSASWSGEFQWRGDAAAHWVRLSVRDEASRLALIGNPIYLQPGSPR